MLENLNSSIHQKATNLIELCRSYRVTVTTIESCTGGLVSAALTDIPGSSEVFNCGFVTYSNEAKHRLVNVPLALIAKHGAVSQSVAIAMARGGLKHSTANFAVSITGVAGPGGGTAEKPVGLVHFACVSHKSKPLLFEARFSGDRNEIRSQSVEQALLMLNHSVETNCKVL
jgi:nicotinamide-nucleotide amidase